MVVNNWAQQKKKLLPSSLIRSRTEVLFWHSADFHVEDCWVSSYNPETKYWSCGEVPTRVMSDVPWTFDLNCVTSYCGPAERALKMVFLFANTIHCILRACIRTALWGRDPVVAGVWRGVWRCTRSFNFRIWQVHTHLQYKCSTQEKKKPHMCMKHILKQSSSQTVVVNLHGEFFVFFSWKALPAPRQPKQPIKTTQSL